MPGGYPPPQIPGGYPPHQMSGGYPALPMPPEIAQQAASYQLGALTQLYQANLIKLISFAGIPLALTIIDIPAVIAENSNIIVLLILLAVTIYAIWYLATNFNLKAYVFTEGLIRAQGSKIDVMRWEHVEAVWEKIVKHRYRGLITIYTSYNYTVSRGDGAQFKFGSALKNTKQLGVAIQQEATRRQLPKATAAYDSGNPANFGPLSVSMQGISKNGVLVPWNQVGQVNVRRGWLIVPKQGSMLAASRTRSSLVPNLEVFLQLVEHARRRASVASNQQYFPYR
jgi:hypothetical protein